MPFIATWQLKNFFAQDYKGNQFNFRTLSTFIDIDALYQVNNKKRSTALGDFELGTAGPA